MASLNACSFTGNLTKDAESRMVGETEVATFSIAVNGAREKDETMFLNCDLWRPGKVGEYLTRGKTVAVSGRLKCRRYEKDGQKREAWSLEVKELALLGGAREKAEAEATPF
jgi:single stranded DNA-binding protein